MEKGNEKNVSVIMPETENLTQDQTGPTLEIMTADQKADLEVSKFQLGKDWIAKKKIEYSGLTIAGVDDKEGFKKVETAWREVRNKRLAVAGKHKELKADYLVITRKIDGAKNELTELLEEIEAPLKKELDRIEQIKEDEQNREENERQARLQTRVVELLENGMKFDGSFYSIAKISMDVATLKTMEPDHYERLLEMVKAENQEILNKIAADNLAKENERLALEKQKADQELEAKKLADEREEIAKEKRAARVERLLGMGYVYNEAQKVFIYEIGKEKEVLNLNADPGYITADEWALALKYATKFVEDANKANDAAILKAREDELAKEKAEKERQIIALRVQGLENLGFKKEGDCYFFRSSIQPKDFGFVCVNPDQLSIEDISVWNEIFKNSIDKIEDIKANDLILEKEAEEKKVAEDKALKEKLEAERLASLSHAERVREWLTGLSSAMSQKPVLVEGSPKVAELVEIFDNNIATQIEWLSDALDKIENQ